MTRIPRPQNWILNLSIARARLRFGMLHKIFPPYSLGTVPKAGFARNELRVYALACAIELKQRIGEKRRRVAKLSARQDELRVGDVNIERAGIHYFGR